MEPLSLFSPSTELNVVKGHGYVLIKNLLSEENLEQLKADTQIVTDEVPFWIPTMPKSGTPFRYRMTCAGPLKWVSDHSGYRYEKNVGRGSQSMWIPQSYQDTFDLALRVGGIEEMMQVQTVLINDYNSTSKLGLHKDSDEESENAVISMSFHSSCNFVFDKHKFILDKGDIFIMHGPGRRAVHGVEKILGEHRINLTARQVYNHRIDVTYKGEHLNIK